MAEVIRRAGVFGKPVSHSLSPVTHNAGYRAAGLTGWTYTARECGEPDLPGVLAGLDATWAGLSLTMPLKQVGLTVADEVSSLARTLGAANTLYPRGGRWLADNTDAPGMVDALRHAGVVAAERVAVLGAGGTARAALAAAAELGAGEVVVYARRREAVEGLRTVAERLDVDLVAGDWDRVSAKAGQAEVLICTLPAGAADPIVAGGVVRPGLAIFDVLYDPWPTPLAAAGQAAGCTVVGGLELLLAQAVRQFELFTETPAPTSAMREALYAAAVRR